MQYIQKSFAKGIRSPSVLTRYNLKGNDECARELYNILIGRQGEAYRRGGTDIVASESDDIERIIPFYTSTEVFLLAFSRGAIASKAGSQGTLRNTLTIKVYNVTEYKKIIQDSDNFDSSDFLDGTPVQIYAEANADALFPIYKSYYRDIGDGYGKDELKGMDYDQVGNVMIFTSDSFPPFYIRKEEDDFIYYRNGIDLVASGDNQISQGSLNKAARTLPYSYYGFGLEIDTIDRRDALDVRFRGKIILKDSFDSQGLAKNRLKFWRNRAFFISTTRRDEDQGNDGKGLDLKTYSGLIRDIRIDSNGDYIVSGNLNEDVDENIKLSDVSGRDSNLYVSDWSARLGFPRSIAVYENRICFFSSEAYPAKLWFSAQPSIQRILVGRKTEVSTSTDTSSQTNIERSIYNTVYFDQLDMFNTEIASTGALPNQASASGSYFINDNKGFSGSWIKAGEVLFIGTNQGIFTSVGTNVEGNNPTPFNSGFVKSIEHPVKRVLPIVVDESLYYISEDNSIQKMRYSRERNGFTTQTIDSLAKTLVKDVYTRGTIKVSYSEWSLEPTGSDLDQVDEATFERTYEVFNARTRIIFDWINRALFVLREGQPYLSYTHDIEAETMGWTRGDFDLTDCVFLKTLPFNPPLVSPSLFGIKDGNILRLTNGVQTAVDPLPDGVPNGVDQAIYFKERGDIDLGNLKDSIKDLDYDDDDFITIAGKDGIIVNTMKVREMRGKAAGGDGDEYVIGKSFSHILTLWFPFVQTRNESSLGSKFNPTTLIFNSIRMSDCFINERLAVKKVNPFAEKYGYGSSFLEYQIEGNKDFDPIVELKSTSPFPFSVGGYILEMNTGAA